MPPSAARVASRFHGRSAMTDWETLGDESKAVVLGAWMFDLRQGLNGRPGTVYMGGRPNPTKVTVDGDARLKLVGFAVPEVGFVEYDHEHRLVKVLSRTGTVLAHDIVNVRLDYTTSALKAAGKALSYASTLLLNDLKRKDAGVAPKEVVREPVNSPTPKLDASWVASLTNFVSKAKVQHARLDQGYPGGPYQTSNTTMEQASVDIGPWLLGQGMSGKAFASALAGVSARAMHPVGEHMGLREFRGAPMGHSNAAYTMKGDTLVLTYRETIYFN